jgi:SEC-C motif domain protein
MPSLVALTPPTADQPCSCGTGKAFAECCGPILSGQRKPDSAEALMRSRFTAHVVQDYAYLHRTYWPTAKQPYVPEPDAPTIKWTRLIVHSHEPGANADTAFVDFSAYYFEEGGPELLLAEKSEFKRIDDQWYFTRTIRNGPAPVKSSTPKVGRNDPCPCGSGKKYKQCCLSKAA